MTHAGHIVVEVVVPATHVSRAVTMSMSARTVTMSEMVVMMMVMMRMIPIGIVPTPVIAVPIVGTVPVVVIVPRIVISVVVRIIVSVVTVGIESPVPGVADIDVCGASTCVVIVIIIERSAGSRAETLDA